MTEAAAGSARASLPASALKAPFGNFNSHFLQALLAFFGREILHLLTEGGALFCRHVRKNAAGPVLAPLSSLPALSSLAKLGQLYAIRLRPVIQIGEGQLHGRDGFNLRVGQDSFNLAENRGPLSLVLNGSTLKSLPQNQH